MAGMGILLCAIAIAALILSAAWVCLARWRLRRIMERMGRMLEAAADGSFQEQSYDESLLSSIETKLAHYLAASEQTARALAKEKEQVKQLISDISHQTKTPVANLLLYAQMLEEAALPQEAQAFVLELNRQAQKLNFLTAALVKATRLEAGMIVMHPGKHAVAPMLEEVLHQIAPKAEQKQIALTFFPQGLTAWFDWKWTIEAIYNIVDNAVKYTPQHGAITVSLLETELFVRIEICDNGIGIPEEETAQIFQRFYRGTKSAGQEGAGIGLYLARQMVMQENGYLKVRSNVGKGSSFYVYLPNEG